MEMIEESSKYLLTLINDILDLTKIDSGQTEIEMEVFSPEDLIDAMLSLLKTQFDQKRHKCRIFDRSSDKPNLVRSSQMQANPCSTCFATRSNGLRKMASG